MEKTFEKRAAIKRCLAASLAKAFIVAVALFAAATLAAPPAPAAADSTEIAHLRDAAGNDMGFFNSVSEILCDKTYNACAAGGKLYMIEDWTLTSLIEIPEGKTLTIDMNGHLIDGQEQYGIKLYDNANLTLEASSNEKRTFTYNGYTWDHSRTWWEYGNTYDYKEDFSITTGGLFARGYTGTNGAIAMMGNGCTVTLKNVAMGGFKSDIGPGAISANANCTINLESGTVIEHGKASSGTVGTNDLGSKGGNLKLNMTNAVIKDNYSGAIEVYGPGNEITMNDNSKLEGNVSFSRGGGISFFGTNFKLTGDGTGVITNNWAARNDSAAGGGIYTGGDSGSTSALIENVTISNNRSTVDGGGLYLKQEGVTVRNCKITGNTVREDGGGIYVDKDDNIVDDCTVTGNVCNTKNGSWEGGGVFVSYKYDLKMSGLCIVKNNTRGKDTGNDDDVFLSTISGQTGFAYITGSLSKGSSVGVRTGITEDRRIAKNFTPPSGKDCFFINLGGYYVSYGTDEGGDAWQRHADLDFNLSVNGTSTGKYKWKSEAKVNATSTDSSKVFKRWNADDSTGLYPVSDCITDENAYDPQLSFKMPQNNVNLAAEYVTRTRKVTVALQAPRVGQRLDYEGDLTWTAIDGDDEAAHEMKIAVSWYKKASDGTLAPAAGEAEEGAVYVARMSVDQDVKRDRAFALDLAASDVEVNLTNGTKKKLGAAEAKVDASGALNITTNGYELGAVITKIKPISLVFPEGTSRSEFESKFPKTATGITAAGTLVNLSFADGQDMDSLFKDGKLVKPSENPATLNLELKKTDEATLPDGLTAEVKLSVTDADAEEIEAPTISLDEGSYSSDDSAVMVKDGKITLAVNCSDTDAQIKYNLSHLGNSEWKSDESSASCSGEIGLPLPEAGKQLTYKLEVWAVKDGSMSAARTLVYTVKNAAQPEMKTVTIDYADTAVAGQGASWDSETRKVEKGSPFAFTAPEHEGYSFEKWVDSSGKTISTGGTVELGEVSSDELITAVYNPVVSGLDVSFALPQADQALAASADCVKAKIANSGKYADVTKYFAGDDGKVAIEWSHGGKGGASAAHTTAYAATMTLNISSSDGVKYVLSPDPEILISGNEGEYGAYAAEEDGKASMSVICPTTGAYELPSIGALSDEKVSFEQAQRCKKRQDAGQGAAAWNLPDQVKVTYKCGESEMLDIAWDSIDSFNESAGAQELTAKGTVAFPEYVDNDDGQGGLVSNEVSVKVRVFAPGDDPYVYDLSAAKVTLSKAAFAYNGKAQKPSVKSVVLNGKTLKAGTDYTASVASGKKVGTYAVTVTAKGSYTGKATTSFVVNPKGVTKFKVSKAKKSFKAKWKKAKAQRSGVQVKYSTKKSMAKAKTVKAKGASAKAKTVKKLKSKKKYYVQARTYKVVNGKTYYSSWSAKKAVKTK